MSAAIRAAFLALVGITVTLVAGEVTGLHDWVMQGGSYSTPTPGYRLLFPLILFLVLIPPLYGATTKRIPSLATIALGALSGWIAGFLSFVLSPLVDGLTLSEYNEAVSFGGGLFSFLSLGLYTSVIRVSWLYGLASSLVAAWIHSFLDSDVSTRTKKRRNGQSTSRMGR